MGGRREERWKWGGGEGRGGERHASKGRSSRASFARDKEGEFGRSIGVVLGFVDDKLGVGRAEGGAGLGRR